MKKILPVLILIAFLSCEKDKIPGTESVLSDGLTPAINNLVPPNVLHLMEDMHMPLFGGSNPPNIEGSYIISPFQIINSNIPGDNLSQTYPPYHLTLYDQNNSNLTVKINYYCGPESGNGIAGFIVGKDCNFTIFAEVTTVYESYSAKTVQVISGTVGENGLGGVFYSNFMLDDHGAPTGILIPNSTGRVFKDRDGFTNFEGEDSHFYSGLPDCPCEYSEVVNGRLEVCGTWELCGAADQSYHYGATSEARWLPPRAGMPGQQCTYDALGKLITGGIAAGSPDKVSPMSCGIWSWINNPNSTNQAFIQHFDNDILPWKEIPCKEYQLNWPANNGGNCPANIKYGIGHLLMPEMVGQMTSYQVTILIKNAKETVVPNIDQDLKNYILGINPQNLTKPQLIEKLEAWKNNMPYVMYHNLHDVINIAIANLSS